MRLLPVPIGRLEIFAIPVSTTSCGPGNMEAIMKSFLLGVISAVAVFVLLLCFLSRAPGNASIIESIDFVEAVERLAFVLGWGLGLPTPFALLTAACVMLIIPVTAFLLVRRFMRRFDGRGPA